MLIHLLPTLHCGRFSSEACELIDITCPELGLKLSSGKEVVARRPFPNKQYLVACRNVGQKAMEGILIEAPSPLKNFVVITRWAVAASHVATHRVEYLVLDTDHDLVSEHMQLWYAACERLGGWVSRWPSTTPDRAPMVLQPRMEASNTLGRMGLCVDKQTPTGLIQERIERFAMPTLEVGRLNPELHDRLPSLAHAFKAGG